MSEHDTALPSSDDEACEHEYVYNRPYRKHECTHCGEEPPADWYDED